MGKKKIPGLQKRFGVWQIDKRIFGQRVCESTGTASLEDAEKYLLRRVEEVRQAVVFGVRKKRTFKEAAAKFVLENQHKASIGDDISRLKILMPHIGNLYLDTLHMGTLETFITASQSKKNKIATINHGLKVVRRILNLATSEWVDENGLTWLHTAPKIKLSAAQDARKPYPLNWDEQDRLFKELPAHLEKMALFAVNTGCRDAVICGLRWEWEIQIDEKNSVFVIPGEHIKNRQDCLIVLNQIAQSVVNSVRGQHNRYVFTYKGKPIQRMLNSAWKKARKRAYLEHVRVHDLKHTFGRRLRSAGVSFEDRQDLLGHKSARITTHYSGAELYNLIDAANRVCVRKNCGPILKLISQSTITSSRESHEKYLRLVGANQ